MKIFNFLNDSSSRLLTLSIVALIAVTFSSCGTISNAVTGGKRPSFIVNAPKDVVLKLDGKELDIKSELFASTSGQISSATSSSKIQTIATRNFYTSAVNIPYKKPVTLEISSASTGKTATIKLKPKRQSAIFWCNLIFCPIVGHIIDGVTNNNKILTPRYIDVASVLDNVAIKDWPSQGKLKRLEKSKAKRNSGNDVSSR
jgi:hypothetical protein